MITSNYHTHTYRCHHAEGDCTDYILEAKRAGLRTLGFSEHIPLPNDRWGHVHMDREQLPEYVDTVRKLQLQHNDLAVLLGGECEFVREHASFYKDVLLGEYDFDYLLGAPHWIPCDGEWIGFTHLENAHHLDCFASYCIDVIESGLFRYIAHPDVFMAGYGKWDANAASCASDIIDAAVCNQIPLELNANGLRKSAVKSIDEIDNAAYPNRSFWQMVSEKGAAVIIGSDAHAPSLLVDSIDICEELAQRLSLNLIDSLLK